MRGRFVITVFALALAQPAAFLAQNPPAQQPPEQQPPAQQPPAETDPQPPAAPKLSFTTPAGLLLLQIKPDQTAAFEEMVGKMKTGLATTSDATLKQQASGLKFYKASDPMQGNALYVVMIDPAVPNAEYEFFGILTKVMTPEQLRAPETQEMFKKYQAAFAAGYNKVNLTPVE